MSQVLSSISLAGIAGLLGVAELSTPNTDYLTTLLAAVGSAAAGVTGLIIAVNAVLKRIQSATEPGTPPPLDAVPHSPNHPPAAAFLVALVASLAIFAGISCSASTSTKILALREAYTATVETAVAARQAGLIDDADWLEIELYRMNAATLLNSLEVSLNTRTPPTPGQIYATADAITAFGEAITQ